MGTKESRPAEDAVRLKELYKGLFSKTDNPSRAKTDAMGNYIMPTAYRPSRITYASQVK